MPISFVRRALALALTIVLLAACSGGDPQSEPPPDGTAQPEPGDSAPPESDTARTRIQDVWIYERMATVDLEGELVDLGGPLLADLEAEAEAGGDAIELVDGMEVVPVPSLAPHLVDPGDGVRDDVSVEAGVVSTANGSAVMVVATPDVGAPGIDHDDEVSLDLTAVEDLLAPGDPLVVDYTFAATHGPDGDQTFDTGWALLRHRIDEGRFRYAAAPGSDRTALFTNNLGEAVDGSVRGVVPAKAQPALDGFEEGIIDCLDEIRLIGCIDDYGETFTEGAAESDDLISEQLELDPPGEDPPADDPPADDPPGEDPPAEDPPAEDPPADDPPADDPPADDPPADDPPDDPTQGGFTPSPSVKDETCVAYCTDDPEPEWCWFNCEDPAPPKGDASADPHLRTFDELSYDLQALGEFVFASRDGWEVQVRFGPAGEDRTASVATAAAMQMGETVVIVDATDRPDGAITVDGEEVDVGDDAVPVERGEVLIRRWRGNVQVHHPDLGMVSLYVIRNRMGVAVVDAGRADDWVGLLGNGDGDPENDLRMRTGEQLDPEPGFDVLHGPFADSWRISDEESLFEYGPGESTATFTDRTYPDAPTAATVDSSPIAARARTLCELAGLTEAAERDACVTDYVVTGDISLVVELQRRHAVDAVLAGGRDPRGDAGFVAVDGSLVEANSHLAADEDLILVRVEGEDDVTRLLGVDATTGRTRWTVDEVSSACAPALTDEVVVAQLRLADPPETGSPVPLVALDRQSGAELARYAPTDLTGECKGRLHVLGDGGVVLGVRAARTVLDVASGSFEVRWRQATDEGVTAERGASFYDQVVATDQHVVMIADDGAETVTAYLFAAADGAVTTVPLPVTVAGSPSVSAVGGDLVAVTGNGVDDAGAVVLVDVARGAQVWSRTFEEGDDLVSHFPQVAASGDVVAGWTTDRGGSDGLGVLAASDGATVGFGATTSFANNTAVAAGDGLFVVHSFGGHYLEAFDETGASLWTVEDYPDGVDGITALGPIVAGRVIVAGDLKDGSSYVGSIAVDR